jgi:iron complex transport system substrate-binding protein
MAHPASVTLKDDAGNMVRVERPASTIVSLTPHLTELAYAAGAGGMLIGVAEFSDYPAAAHAVRRIGDASRADIEVLYALKPALALAWLSGNPAAERDRLRKLGIPLYVSEIRTFDDVARVVRDIGRLAGTTEVADSAASRFQVSAAALRAEYSGRRPLRVFYEIWHRPLMTVNGRHLISEAIQVCGGVNVFADARVLTPRVSLEAVIAMKPDVIVGGGSAAHGAGFVEAWRSYPVAALRKVPVKYLPPDTIQRATPRILEGARTLCGLLDQARNAAGVPD